MKTIESVLREEMLQLESIVSEARLRLETAPKGRLRIAKKGRSVEYYYKNIDVCNSNGRYLKKGEEKIARKIAQRDYDARIEKNAEKRIKATSAFLKEYENTNLKRIYQKTNEYPLMLEGNVKIYPDFTILKMPARKEVYLEHLGMMDDSNYVDNVIYKMSTYERNGIYLGVNLFITHETSKMPLNTRALDGLIRNLFCAE